MLKLMKYELRKQMFSKLIILIGIAILETYFLFGVLKEDEKVIAKAISIFIFATTIAIFYVGVESISVFNRDLKTKQSYMLYMIPYSTYSIVGAKIIAAFLQIVFTGLLFLGAIIVNFIVIFARFTDTKEIFRMLKLLFQQLLEVTLDLPYLFSFFFFLFFLWMTLVLCGMFAISLSSTFLANNRFRTPVSIVVFLLFLRLISFLSNVILPSGTSQWKDWVEPLVTGIYLGVVSILLYIGTAWMLDKKVSV